MARYNESHYNGHQYNTDALALMLNLPSESLSIAGDMSKVANLLKVESAPIVDVTSKTVSRPLSEVLTLTDQTIRTIDEKVVADNVDIDVWITIDKNSDNSSFTGQL